MTDGSQKRTAAAVTRSYAAAARAGARRLPSGLARRAGWGFADQLLSSLSNFALSAAVAATVSARDFGTFTLAYAVYNVCVGVSGGLASVPLVVRYSAAAPTTFRAAARASVGTALVIGALAGAACVLVAALTDSALAGPLLALGLTLPGLCTQDAWRYSFATGGRPARAAANDGAWLLLQALAIVALLLAGSVSATSMVLAWGGAAAAAAALGCVQHGALPAPLEMRAWLREQRQLGPRYAAEAVLHRSSAWVALAVIG